MTESFYISETAFELLVRSQCDDPMLLPCSASLEELSEEAVLFTLGELSEVGALVANEENERFDVSETFVQIISAIVTAKSVVQFRGIFDEDSHFVYIGRNGATFVDVPVNRLNKFRIGIVPTDSFAEEVMDRIDPNATAFCIPEEMTADLPQMTEENLQTVGNLGVAFSDVIALDGVMALADFFPPNSDEAGSRLCLFFTGGVLKVIHIISGQSTCEPFSTEMWKRLLTKSAEVSA